MFYKWDASDYARSSSAQQQWVRELIAKLHLKGNERLLDIGSGDGKVTAEIASLLSTGSVVGLDNSTEMVTLAQASFPRNEHPNLEFLLGDASLLAFVDEFDVIFSNATLHWIMDHRPVLAGIHRSLKNRGKALLQMGGRGNAADVVEAMDHVRVLPRWRGYYEDFGFPYGFYGAGEYCKWLGEANLTCGRVEMIHKDMAHPGREAFSAWLRTTWLPYTQRIPPEEREDFLTNVIDRYLDNNPACEDGMIHVQMVRLEVETTKE